MTARIYQPAKTAMQSGAARKRWLLEFEPSEARRIEPLMGWTSSSDMTSQVKLWFDTEEEAVAYAEREGLAYRIDRAEPVRRRGLSYSDNFRFNRIGQWTH
jgi:hypothetical protein